MFEIKLYTQEQFLKMIDFLESNEIKFSSETHSRNCSCVSEFLLIVDYDEFFECMSELK